MVDPLLIAADRGGTEEMFAIEIKKHPKVGSEVLRRLVQWHDWPEQVLSIIERGCNVNERPYTRSAGHGESALHLAGRHNRIESARVLLKHGADKTIKATRTKTSGGSTPKAKVTSYLPYEIALEKKNHVIVDELHPRGACRLYDLIDHLTDAATKAPEGQGRGLSQRGV